MKTYFLFFFFAHFFHFVAAQNLRQDLWQADGDIYASVQQGNILYLGGYFSYLGPYTGTFVVVDSVTGQRDASFPVIDGEQVTSIVSDGSGGWFVGGNFHTVGGVSIANLVHILPNKAVDPFWQPNPHFVNVYHNQISKMKCENGILYVAGDFDSIGGQLRPGFAALDAQTGLATAFSPNPTMYFGVGTRPAYIADWQILNGKMYVSGTFDTIGGQIRHSIAVLDVQTGLATAWCPPFNAPDYYFGTLAVANGQVYVAGMSGNVGFTDSLGTWRSGIAAFDISTGALTSWNPVLSLYYPTVTKIIPHNGDIYLVGQFDSIGGQLRYGLAAVDGITAALQAWNPLADTHQTAYFADAFRHNHLLYITGEFREMGGQRRRCFAAVDINTAQVQALNPLFDGWTYTSHAENGQIFVGGYLNSVGGVERSGLAAIDLSTGLATAWNPSLTMGPDTIYNPSNQPYSYSLALSGNLLYVSGWFDSLDHQARNNVGCFDLGSMTVTSWNPSVSASNGFGFVERLLVHGTTLYANGVFNQINGQSRSSLAAFDAATGTLLSFNAPALGVTYGAMACHNSKIYLGNAALAPDSLCFARLICLDSATGNVLWVQPFDSAKTVYSMVTQGSTLYIGGTFTSFNGQPLQNLLAFDMNADTARAWLPVLPHYYGIYCLETAPGIVYASDGGNVLAFDSASGQPTGWQVSTWGGVYGMKAAASHLFLYGYLGQMNVGYRRNLAAVTAAYSLVSGKVFQDFNANGMQDAGELSIPNVLIQAQTPVSTLNYALTDSNGHFRMGVGTGTYTLSPTLPLYYTASLPATRSVTFAALNQVDSTVDFALQLSQNVNDLVSNGYHLPARPGFPTQVYFTYQNIGTTPQSGTVTLHHADSLLFVSANPTQTTYSNSVLTWTYTSLLPGESRLVSANFTVPTTLALGYELVSPLQISPISGDTTPTNNVDTLRRVVTGSYDPNEKEGPRFLSPDQVNNRDSMTYVVRFQNTGTDTAFTVRVEDDIPLKLDISTLQTVASSHPFRLEVQNRRASWYFDNIQLPDIHHNEAASHGFVKFTIKPLSTLMLGDEIENTAFIFFDFNSPIVTNTVTTTISNLTSVAESYQSVDFQVRLYPNPARDRLTLETNLANFQDIELRITNLQGQMVFARRIYQAITELDNLTLPAGLYFYTFVVQGQPRKYGKLVIR